MADNSQQKKRTTVLYDRFNVGLLVHVLRKSFKWFFLFMLLSSGVAHVFLHFSTRVYDSTGVIIHIGGDQQQSLLGFDKDFQRKDFTGTDFQQDIRVITSPLVLYNAFANKGLNLLFYEVGDFRSLEIYPNPYFTVDSFSQASEMSAVNIDYNVFLSQGKDSVRLEYVYQGKTWGGYLKPGKPFVDDNIFLSISNLDGSHLTSSTEEEKNY